VEWSCADDGFREKPRASERASEQTQETKEAVEEEQRIQTRESGSARSGQRSHAVLAPPGRCPTVVHGLGYKNGFLVFTLNFLNRCFFFINYCGELMIYFSFFFSLAVSFLPK
jgi:hypothetical protein